MALKYRIEYNVNSKPSKSRTNHTLAKYLIPGLLAALIIVILAISPHQAKFLQLILPGDPTVTTNALQEFSNTLSRGESLSSALDVFCEAIMEQR